MRIGTASLLRISLCVSLAWFLAQSLPTLCDEEWIYTIRAGDNLWVLTERYCDSLARLRGLQRLNRISDPYHIPPGTALRIPLAWMKSGPGSARVATFVGPVSITKRDLQSSAVPDAILSQGDLIETGADANVTVQFGDGNRVTLLSGSSLRLETLLDYPNGAGVVGLELLRGRAESEILNTGGSKSRVRIKTPAGITSVRGTELRVGIADAALSRTEVLTGTVNVANAGREIAVEAGHGTIVRKGEPPQTPVALLPAPDLSSVPESITRVSTPLRFATVPGAAAYRVQLAASVSFSPILFEAQLSDPNLVSPPLPNARYVMRVRAIDASGLEGHNAERNLELDIRPDPPVAAEPADAAVIANASPMFRWEVSPGNRSVRYRLQIAHDSAFTKIFADISDLREGITLTQPLPSGPYYWRVAALGEDRRMGPYSASRSLRIVSPAPTVERAIITPTHLRLRWREQTSRLAYRVQLSRDSEFANVVEDRVVEGDSLELSRPAPSRYYLRIRAIEADGYEGPYAPQLIDVNAPPSPPEALSPADQALSADGVVQFNWQPATAAHGYRFQLARETRFQQPLVDTSISAPRFTPEHPLQPGLYFWRVAAENEIDGRGAFSSPQSVRRLVPPPSYLPAAVDATSLSLSWEPEPNASQYEVAIASDEAFERVIALTRASEPRWRLARPPGGRYFVRIRAVDSDGVPGRYGAPQVIDVRPRPVAPRSLTASSRPGESILLKWEPQERQTRQRLQISSDSSFTTLVVDQRQIESATFVVPATLPPAVYHWRVAASTESDGEGEFSQPAQLRISPRPPQIERTELSGDLLRFQWREQQASVQYQLEVTNDKEFRNVVIDRRTTATNLEVPRPPAGRYLARIRSIDADGVPGPYSNTTSVQVPARFPLWLLLPLLNILL
jgi:hypothetical protein